MRRWILSPQADRDFDMIWQYWADQAGFEAAEQLKIEFWEAYDLLASNPQIGHIRSDIKRRVRFWNVRQYLIIYWADTVPLEVLRLAHGAQDMPRVIDEIY